MGIGDKVGAPHWQAAVTPQLHPTCRPGLTHQHPLTLLLLLLLLGYPSLQVKEVAHKMGVGHTGETERAPGTGDFGSSYRNVGATYGSAGEPVRARWPGHWNLLRSQAAQRTPPLRCAVEHPLTAHHCSFVRLPGNRLPRGPGHCRRGL